MGKDLSRKRRKFRHNDDAPNPNDSSDDGRAHSPDADVPAYAGDRDSGVRRRTIAEQARLSPSRGVERGSIWAVRKSQSPRRDHDSDSDGESEEEHRDVFHLDVPYVADDAEAIPTTETHPATLQEDDKPPLNEEEAAELQDLEEEEVVEYLRQKREKIRLDRIRQIEERDAREQAERAAAKEAREQAEKEKWKLTEAQLALMRRTAAAIRSSSTPSVLEMRILANHGGDHRFSFLRRGEEKRWGVEWERLLRGENVQLPASTPQASLLSGYDSESGSDAGRTDEGHEVQLTANRAVERKADAHSGSGKQASIPAQASEMSQEPQEEPKQEAEPADAAQSSATSGREILRAERSGTQKASRLAKARAWALQHRAQTESAKESVGNDAPAEKAQLAEIGDGVND